MSAALIDRIEAKLKAAERLDEVSKHELLGLLSVLKTEIQDMDAMQGDHAESIAGFAGAAAHEAMRTARNPALLKLAMDGLSASVKEVEAEHPQMVETVNGVCAMLANLGI